MTAEGDDLSIDWAAIVPLVVHSTRVEIIEALAWIGQPLSSTELRNVFDEPVDHYLSRVSYHVGKLTEFGILEATGHREKSRRPKETLYFFSPFVGKKARNEPAALRYCGK
jgi:hypothetical protein